MRPPARAQRRGRLRPPPSAAPKLPQAREGDGSDTRATPPRTPNGGGPYAGGGWGLLGMAHLSAHSAWTPGPPAEFCSEQPLAGRALRSWCTCPGKGGALPWRSGFKPPPCSSGWRAPVRLAAGSAPGDMVQATTLALRMRRRARGCVCVCACNAARSGSVRTAVPLG